MYDITVIGTCMAGLYSAYKIKQMFPKISIAVLEKNKKSALGGRTGNYSFHGTQVVTGAGIGRKNKDKLLIQLMDELRVPYTEFETSTSYSKLLGNHCQVKQIFTQLKTEYNHRKRHNLKTTMTFKEFARPFLGKDTYEYFVICSGYKDYENADLYNVLFDYGFDDNYGTRWTGLSIPWKLLVDKLVNRIGKDNVFPNSEVVNIDSRENDHIDILCKNGKIYTCKKVIIATTIDSMVKLIPGAQNKNSPYQQISGQPFLRVYGKFSKSSIPIMEHYVHSTTIVPGPLAKIIPMNPEMGIYMISYTDNMGAIYLKDYLENTAANRNIYCRLIEQSLGVPPMTLHLTSISDFYWPIGTHYYKPLHGPYKSRTQFIDVIQHPMKNMLVVGEAVSINQGWVEGALESVENAVTRKWITI